MRAMIADRRLETIAGSPATFAMEPTLRLDAEPGTAVFVGHRTGDPSTIEVAIQNREGSLPQVANIYRSGSILSLLGGTLLAETDKADAFTATVPAPELGLGRGRYDGQHWRAPFAAAHYDKTLTAAEITRVASWLAARLSLSLPL